MVDAALEAQLRNPSVIELFLERDLGCRNCGTAAVVEICAGVRDPLRHVEEVFSVYECSACQIRFTFPVISNDDIGFLYEGQYFSSGDEYTPAERFYRFDQYRYDLSLFRSLIKKSFRILDYGCGNGSRLEHLFIQGFTNLVGVDRYRPAASRHLISSQCFISMDPIQYRPEKRFDCVLLYHVLEHLPDFKVHLEHIRDNLLVAGGLLVVQVPNSDSWQFKFRGRSWAPLDIPRHYWHFNAKSLSRILNNCGYKIHRVSTRNSILHPASILSSVFNYDIRNEWQRKDNKKSNLRIQIEFIMLHILAVPIAILENLLHNSATLNMVVKKG